MPNKEYNITHTQMGGGELKEDLGGGSSVLTPATADSLGGVKIGNGISVTEDGTISAAGGGAERPVITLMGNEGTTDGHGTRTIPIDLDDYGLTPESPMPIINMLGAGSLILPMARLMPAMMNLHHMYSIQTFHVLPQQMRTPHTFTDGQIMKYHSLMVSQV